MNFSNRRNSGIRNMSNHEILHQSTRSLYSDHNPNNPKMTSENNSDEDNVNDVLRQSNYTRALNCEELSSRYVITMRFRLQSQLNQEWHKYLL